MPNRHAHIPRQPPTGPAPDAPQIAGEETGEDLHEADTADRQGIKRSWVVSSVS